MIKNILVLATFCFGVLSAGRSQLSPSLLFQPPLDKICLYNLSGVNATDNPENDAFTYTVTSLSHNPYTGIVSGSGTFTVVNWVPYDGVTISFDGSVEFSGKVAVVGTAIRIVNAKIELNGTGNANVNGIPIVLTSATSVLNFQTLEIIESLEFPSGYAVSGTTKKSKVTVEFTYEGKKRKGSVSTDPMLTSFEFPAANKVGVTAQFIGLATDSKGKIAGSAEVAAGATSLGIWSVSGKRTVKNGVALNVLNAKSNNGLSSATINLNDSGDLVGTSNKAKLLGYDFKKF